MVNGYNESKLTGVYKMNKYFMDQYIIFDVATIENNGKREITEIAAIKLNEKLEKLSVFNSNVGSDELLLNVLPAFENWIIDGQADCKFMYSWGRSQRNQIIEEAKEKNYKGKIFDLLLYFSSLQHVFKNMKDDKLYTVENAMKKINIEYKKRQCLMDEVYNVVDIFNVIYGKWIHPGIPAFPKPGEIIFTGEKYWLK
jgi:hypothetical protein